MEEIEVGEYGRTNLGNIIKFAWLIKDGIKLSNKVVLIDKMRETAEHFYYFKKGEIITKSSKNITDLIEVGDFVNGSEVGEFDYEDETELGIPVYTPDGLFDTIECYVPLTEIKIKTILTHEQYENNCYRLEEE